MNLSVIVYFILLIAAILYLIFGKESGHIPSLKPLLLAAIILFSLVYWGIYVLIEVLTE